MAQETSESREAWRTRSAEEFNVANENHVLVTDNPDSTQKERDEAKVRFDLAAAEMDEAWAGRHRS